MSQYINNNLNPVWKQTFSWIGVRDSAVLHGEVKDKGTVRDVSLGVFKIPIVSLLDRPGEVHPFTMPLKNKQTGEAEQGRVNLQMCWKLWKRTNEEQEPEPPKWPEFGEIATPESGEQSTPAEA